METKDMKLTIGHLYPDLLNLYGDRGNIACLMKRCIWRGIEAETIEFNTGDQIDFSKLDIVLLGGGSDREQAIVCKSLLEIQSEFKDYVEDGGVVIAVCGGLVLSQVALKRLQKPIQRIGAVLGINEEAVVGLFLSFIQSLAMLPLFSKMDKRGKVLNAAFSVAGAYVVGGQMTLVASLIPGNWVTAYMISKVLSGGLAVALAVICMRRSKMITE